MRDHPRLRGEHVNNLFFNPKLEGSPPPTRGTRYLIENIQLKDGITPAYAGNTTSGARGSVGNQDHPRLRGEHEKDVIEYQGRQGSPPPTRGTHI